MPGGKEAPAQPEPQARPIPEGAEKPAAPGDFLERPLMAAKSSAIHMPPEVKSAVLGTKARRTMTPT